MSFRRPVALFATLLAAGCARKQASPPPPVAVEVVPVVQKDVPIVGEWIGTLDGSVNADIRPKVEGYVLRQFYKEGQFVRRNDPLFEIDPRQFRAALEQARGSLARAEAQAANAAKDVERFTPLAAQRAISQQELDHALSAERDGKGAVASARAAVDQAALSLGWTRVTSPIDGIVGIARTQVGDLVSPQSIMATVSTVDPIRVTIGISEREYMERAALINRASYPTTERGPSLDLIFADGTVFPEKGKAVLVDRDVNVKTGTLTVKGFFPNPHNILRPGQYAHVRAELGMRPGALVVPQRAVTELQGGARVAVAGADGKAEIRSVELGPRTADLFVVEKGLQAGDKVIVTGLQYLRPGTPISVQAAASPAAGPSAEARR
ncbi:MAG TPA: efflux RND transporter periplasmic adaptor subunit [Vicinamibacteria bacterium]|nr:efflux RND transporter periplasmic adaptor subunit [Vicinamibacteria bacterium]